MTNTDIAQAFVESLPEGVDPTMKQAFILTTASEEDVLAHFTAEMVTVNVARENARNSVAKYEALRKILVTLRPDLNDKIERAEKRGRPAQNSTPEDSPAA